METKQIFLFENVYDTSIILMIVSILGLVSQIVFDLYVKSNSGWSTSFFCLIGCFILIIALVIREIMDIITLISLKDDLFSQCLLLDNHRFNGLGLLFFMFIFPEIQMTSLSASVDSPIWNAISVAWIILWVILLVTNIIKQCIYTVWVDKVKEIIK